MPEKPTVATLSERLNSSIGIAKWGSAILVAVLGWLCVTAQSHSERLSRIEQHLQDISEQQKKVIPSLFGDLLKKGPQTVESIAQRAELTTSILASARQRQVVSTPQLLTAVGQQMNSLQTTFPQVLPLWQAGAELVNYKSEQEAKTLSLLSSDCLSQEPHL
jgi:hypothetical protein